MSPLQSTASMLALQQHLDASLARGQTISRLRVALSGGPDSTALLLLTKAVAAQRDLPLVAVHVNHQLQAQSKHWQAHCERWCRERRIELIVRCVQVVQSGNREAHARRARYEALIDTQRQGDALLLAHHARDQAESLLLNWLRGSSVYGVRGMPSWRPFGPGVLLRPLLSIGPAQLHADAELSASDACVDDPMNHDRSLDRVWLRDEVLPRLEGRWANSATRLAKTAAALEEDRIAFVQLLRQRLRHATSPEGHLLLAEVLAEPKEVAKALFVEWLREQLGQLPDRARVDEAWRQFSAAAPDRHPRLVSHGRSIQREHGRLRVTMESSVELPQLPANWQGAPLSLPVGTLARAPAPEGGLRWPAAGLTLRWRVGGERLEMAGGWHREVKDLFREGRIPQSQRWRWPLLYVGDQLANVPSIALAARFRALPGETGFSVTWTPSPDTSRRSSIEAA